MGSIEILKILKLISISLLILFSIFLLSLKKGNRISHIFLSAFLIARVFILLGVLLWDYGLPWKYPDLAFLSIPFLFLYAPMLYLYTESVTIPFYKFNPLRLLHFLPFIIRSLLLFFRYNIHSISNLMSLL